MPAYQKNGSASAETGNHIVSAKGVQMPLAQEAAVT